MLIVVCGNGDQNDPGYHSAEGTFVQRILTRKFSSIPEDLKIKTFSNPKANFPDVNNSSATQAFLTTLLLKIGVNPYEAQLSWEAELYKESGYTFVIFYCTADNPSYSFEVMNTLPRKSGFKGLLNSLFGGK